jgi:hypothetical protein
MKNGSKMRSEDVKKVAEEIEMRRQEQGQVLTPDAVIPRSEMTPAQLGKIGGLTPMKPKTAAKRVLRSAMEAALDLAPEMPTNELSQQIYERYRNNGMNTMADAIAIAQVVKAVGGDTTAAIYVRDTAGEKPTDHVEQSGEITIRLAGVDPSWGE